MRACFGVAVSGAIGVVVTLLTRPPPREQLAGLINGSLSDRIRGAAGSGSPLRVQGIAAEPGTTDDPANLPGPVWIDVSSDVAAALGVEPNATAFVADARWHTLGIRATHVTIRRVLDGPASTITLSEPARRHLSPRGGPLPPLKIVRFE